MGNDLRLTFIHAGLQTSLQDQGRIGLQGSGVPIGGALDRDSALLANHLVGNDANSPVLEITMIGPEILFDSDAVIAVVGAEFQLYSDGVLISNDKAHYLTSGTLIKFGKLKAGCRAYLAVAGIWLATKWKGSVSPLLQAPEATPHSIIKKGSKIDIISGHLNKTGLLSKSSTTQSLSHHDRIRVKPGPEFESISRTAIAIFFGRGHTISQDANRMGYRFNTQLHTNQEESEMISSGIIPGTIQITGSGQLIVLLNDAQTTGGYPRIANIIEADLDRIAQLKPGDKVWFELLA